MFDVLFSETVTGFDGSDILFAGSTAGGPLVANVSGSGSTYTVSVTGMTTSGTVFANIRSGAAQDVDSNASSASTSTDNAVSFVNTPPTVTINQGAGQSDPANTGPIVFDVLFSETVTGFDGSDILFAGSTAGGPLVANVSGSGSTYTVSVTGMTTSGTVFANIRSGAAQDVDSNASSASTSTDNAVSFVNTPPTVTINQGAGQSDPANTGPIVFDVLFSETVTGFDGSDILFAGSTAGGPLVANVSGSGSTYTVSVTGMTTSGTVFANIRSGAAQDVDSNASSASTSTDNAVSFGPLPNGAPVNTLPGTQEIEANTCDRGQRTVGYGTGLRLGASITTMLSVTHGTLTVASAGGATVSGQRDRNGHALRFARGRSIPRSRAANNVV